MREISINLSGSKSITNRVLLLNSLFNNSLQLQNLSKSQDSQMMKEALSSKEHCIDIHHAGTAMRFLTAFFSIQENRETILTGSHRMKERPIKILVDALNQLGANISYVENEGYPPLEIKGKGIKSNIINLPSNISSQYITALCLIGTKLEKGLVIELEGKITSKPYITMTLQILNKIGIKTLFNQNKITIYPVSEIKNQPFIIESDWSSASYHYSICALSENLTIKLKYLFEDSLQADRRAVDIYQKFFGINTTFNTNEITLCKQPNFEYPNFIELDMNDCPDIAQTVALTAFGLRIPIKITGLETLKIKETDRLVALKNEIEKCGGKVEITDNSFTLLNVNSFNANQKIETYNDHRMAMSFAPLKLLFPLEIKNPDVVVKSYVEFWNDMKFYGIKNHIQSK
ncbi:MULTISPECIES: 3-phosphoshikimate 1-carboxyvinyltransferase [unclassified Apibacter]|uniref:3-phosphoshikimate 1-carboxyvinyltransferase n=1 Tax=unclassified Apibacter TaxID=2630820 RepID=UPI0013280EA4|nr:MULTISPECIES: 3-phosphoshikimate 1-carboxyvinyltransferase [unclassified Apibacter]MCX8676620.1 3-phosphoshikimate 1-carboxyvinyltransferase [Apibacter sp. B3919]MXO24078.1 3-phosphoshikimate 1-carboxyvinyltransferase [Apibacter sp. B3924]MXO26241.1 3-phosphoshikimate 1-carboxyvinyltransferase [Apibacter sp. B3813]MXO28192.1 3-phosphoshikimate 1-carboxyvinyltransferase [Apibacter sp. B3913]MXO30146.1 3-phosphoshikimate 1-carboxyvinyltransferase [Apibacter sp. B3912]